MQTVPDVFMFLGRFHPLFVHLPIGLLVFTLFAESMLLWKPRESFKKIIPILWLFSALGAACSAASGYLLSLGGGYEEDALSFHKNGGIALCCISTTCYLLYVLPLDFMKKTVRPIRYLLVLGAGVLLVTTGHGGGSLAHGSNYLTEFRPIQTSAVGGADRYDETALKAKASISSLDSADIFKHVVMPILQSKCVSCHNEEKKKGGLLLTSYDAILAGGKTKEGVMAGNTANSEIFRRITLPKNHKEFMPTDGKKPLTENQVSILEWWIETGAQQNMMIASMHPDKKMQDVLEDFFQIGEAAIISYAAKAPDRNNLADLLKAGFQVNMINKGSNLIEVKFNGNENQKPNLGLLKSVQENLVWLHLTNCGITDEDLVIIGGLPNLYKLNLNRNAITDKGIVELANLSKLEYLNLYGTSITEKSLPGLIKLPKLKKLYAWETAIDSSFSMNGINAAKDLELVFKLAQ